MKTIYRYELPITDRSVVSMPTGAVVLQHPPSPRSDTTVEIWAEVDPTAPEEDREFVIVGTGNPLPTSDQLGPFVGTVGTYQGRGVWHIYEAAGR